MILGERMLTVGSTKVMMGILYKIVGMVETHIVGRYDDIAKEDKMWERER
jgi:hypothetical protein